MPSGPPISQAWWRRPAESASKKAASASPWPKNAACSRGCGAPASWSGSRSSVSAGMGLPRRRGGRKLGTEARLNGGPDLIFDRIRRLRRVDYETAFGLARGDAQESLAEALMEAYVLGLET